VTVSPSYEIASPYEKARIRYQSECIDVRDAALVCIEEYFGENFLSGVAYQGKAIVAIDHYGKSKTQLCRFTIPEVPDEDFEKARVKIEARIRQMP